MIEAALMILILLYIFGFISIPGLTIPNIQLFVINGHHITLYEILIVVVIFWIIGLLSRWLRLVAGILLVIWLLSTLGFIAIHGLGNIILVVLIIGLLSHRSFHYYHRYYRSRFLD